MIEQLVLNSVVLGSTIALMAVGFTLIFGILRIVNFWHGEAYMFGAAIVYFVSVRLGISYIGALIAAVVAVGLMGWVSYGLVFRRFHGNLLGALVVGIAMSLAFQNSMWYALGARPVAIPSVITGTITLFGTTVSSERLLVSGVSILVILTLAWFIKFTRLGQAMRAVQQDSEAARTQGISVRRIAGLTFGIATGLAALAGGLVAPLFHVAPPMGAEPLLITFIVVILGGLGSVMGALVVSFIIGFQQCFMAAYWGSEYVITASFALAMLVLIFRPTGLMGHE